MEYIKKRKEILQTLFPVRKSRGQKAEFCDWLLAELKSCGWKAHSETYGKLNGSVNVVAGDPGKAVVYLVAHYDTASRMLFPNFVSPTNPLFHILYHFGVAVLLLIAVFLLSFAVAFPLNQPALMLPLFLVLAIGVLYISAFGPANTSNANSNTSGVLALLSIANRLQKDKRVCLLFLDNNERNLLGASAFKKKHVGEVENCLFINFDCVGDGAHMLLMPSKMSRWDEALLAALRDAFQSTEGVNAKVVTEGLAYYPSDHRKFKFHVAVAACRKKSGLCYYIPHLRTKKDTVLREENIAWLAEGVERFLPLYLDTDNCCEKGE